MTESDSQSKDETAEVLGRDESKKSPGSKLESVSRSASYSPSPPRSLPPPSPPSRQSSTSLSPQHFRTSRSRSPVSRRNGESSNRSERRENREEVRSIEVSGLTKMVRESHLEYIFSQYGTITNIILPTFRMSGESRGKGYVVYRSTSGAQKAEEYMDEGQVDGAIVTVRLARVPERDEDRGSRSYSGGTRQNDAHSHSTKREAFRPQSQPFDRGGYSDRQMNWNNNRQGYRQDTSRRRSRSREPDRPIR